MLAEVTPEKEQKKHGPELASVTQGMNGDKLWPWAETNGGPEIAEDAQRMTKDMVRI